MQFYVIMCKIRIICYHTIDRFTFKRKVRKWKTTPSMHWRQKKRSSRCWRPCQIDTSVLLKIPMPGEYSFPSGHTLHAFTAATMIFLHHKKAGVACLILAVLIAYSRMYLFVHFPTDVLAGMLLGIVVAHTVYRISLRKRKAEQKA